MRGIDINIPVIYDMAGLRMTSVGTADTVTVKCHDSFTAYC